MFVQEPGWEFGQDTGISTPTRVMSGSDTGVSTLILGWDLMGSF